MTFASRGGGRVPLRPALFTARDETTRAAFSDPCGVEVCGVRLASLAALSQCGVGGAGRRSWVWSVPESVSALVAVSRGG